MQNQYYLRVGQWPTKCEECGAVNTAELSQQAPIEACWGVGCLYHRKTKCKLKCASWSQLKNGQVRAPLGRGVGRYIQNSWPLVFLLSHIHIH